MDPDYDSGIYSFIIQILESDSLNSLPQNFIQILKDFLRFQYADAFE